MIPIETQSTIGVWGRKTFGDDATTAILAKRAADEIEELRAALAVDPQCLLESTQEEAADVLIFLYRIASEGGFNLMAAGDRKMQINRRRRWTRNEDGSFTKVEVQR